MLRVFGPAGVATFLLAAAPVHASTTFGSALATANASANTNYGEANAGTGYGTDTESLSSFDTALEATAGAQADSYGKKTSVTSTASALEDTNLTLASAASGTIDFAGITSATSTKATDTGEAYSEGQGLTYDFTVDTASVFSLTYNYSESFTDPYFYNSIYLGDTSTGALITSKDPSGANTSGALSFNLDPGSYTFNVYTQVADDAYSAAGGSAAGEHEELYQFNIAAAAPEPSTWALLMLSVGVTGAALRARRRPATQAA